MTIRNAIIILLLCLVLSIVAADPFKGAAPLVSDSPAGADILGAVPAGRPQPVPRSVFSRGRSEELQDAVAGSPIPEVAADNADVAPNDGNSTPDLGGPPRGGGNGGFDSLPPSPTSVGLGGPPRGGGGDGGFAPLTNNPRPIISPSGPAPASVDLPQ